MKKLIKRFTAIVTVIAMALALTVSVKADTLYTITAPDDDDHTYEIYQIFTGDLSNNILSNVKWGKNGTGTTGASVNDAILTELSTVNSKTYTEKLEVIKKYVNFNSETYGTIYGQKFVNEDQSNAVHSMNVDPGYYLIKDKDNSVSGYDSYTLYYVKIVNNITIDPKSDVPKLEKKVKDINDSQQNSTTDWQDSADYDIGDKVPFQLKGTVADNYNDYKQYYFAFHDVEDEGLTFDSESVIVYVNGSIIDESQYKVKSDQDDGCTFEIVFDDLKSINTVSAGSVITVEYTSTLNDKAILGNQGNVNKAKLEFSNNPNNDQKGVTSWDEVIVFTYKVVINKVNENKDPLSGAEFTLCKKLADGDTKPISVIKNTNGTVFTFKGLDDGNYVLTETKTPDGYNTIGAIEFIVTADHDIKWIAQTKDSILTSLNGNNVSGEIIFTSKIAEGSLTANVVNKSGSTLPETGGIGTTIFYVVGSILVVGAAILLVAKRRTDKE